MRATKEGSSICLTKTSLAAHPRTPFPVLPDSLAEPLESAADSGSLTAFGASRFTKALVCFSWRANNFCMGSVRFWAMSSKASGSTTSASRSASRKRAVGDCFRAEPAASSRRPSLGGADPANTFNFSHIWGSTRSCSHSKCLHRVERTQAVIATPSQKLKREQMQATAIREDAEHQQ